MPHDYIDDVEEKKGTKKSREAKKVKRVEILMMENGYELVVFYKPKDTMQIDYETDRKNYVFTSENELIEEVSDILKSK